MLGYKHTAEAIAKMRLRLSDKNNHPCLLKLASMGKTYNRIFKSYQLEQPGELNPMFNKNHSTETKAKMSINRSKRPLGLYDKENNLIKTYKNQVELATEFKVFKSTIGRYIKSKNLFQDKYFIRELNK